MDFADVLEHRENLACMGNYLWRPKADYLLPHEAVTRHFEAYWLP
jgi:hypothetical protein